MWFVLVQPHVVPQLEAGDGEQLIPAIRPSGLKFALKSTVVTPDKCIRCDSVLLGAIYWEIITRTNGSFC